MSVFCAIVVLRVIRTARNVQSDPEWGSLQAKYLVLELENELATFDVRFVNLKGIVEVIPRKLNKGVIVTKILRDAASRNNGVDFVLCMGDDISDEKMFTVCLGSLFTLLFHFELTCISTVRHVVCFRKGRRLQQCDTVASSDPAQ